MKCATARSAAVKVMPCRSSLASGVRRPFARARSTSRSKGESTTGAATGFTVVARGAKFSCDREEPAALGFGTTGRRSLLSGVTPTIAALNRSTSLAMGLM